MRAERRYLYRTLRCMAETFAEYKLALLEEACPEADIACLSVSYGAITQEFCRLKRTLFGKDDIPRMGMFMKPDGKFDNYAFHTVKMLYQSNTAARSSVSMLDELVYAGKVIKRYLSEK